MRYRFGRNWQRYLQETNDSLAGRLNDAERYVAALAPDGSLVGRSFLDVGSGSGLFSLAAHRLGAVRIVSLDYDGDSVEATQRLRALAGAPAGWRVLQMDMLDGERMAGLGEFDLVHCAGVAHHTGDMWRALANLVPTTADGGTLFVSIYNHMALMSPLWRVIKRCYNALVRRGGAPTATSPG